MAYRDDIFELFQAAVVRDRARSAAAPEWLFHWDYQDKREGSYGADLFKDFDAYDGPSQLCTWFNWASRNPKPDYFPDELTRPLIEASRDHDEKLVRDHGLSYEFSRYEPIGRNNAHDLLLPNFYLTPERQTNRHVLDFGAGYGRHANLWPQRVPNLVLVGMDAIALPYCLQHLYYSAVGNPFFDYVAGDDVRIEGEGPALYHVPTWRADLLPDNYFDLVMCVQVLPELSPDLANFAVELFARVLRPGGALYIRDHAPAWNPSGIDLEPALVQQGFTLEFRPHLRDRADMHGLPRIWRKIDPAAVET